ncbi:nucleoside triphosphate pyrophosphohydrolase [Alsobacter soli]|uniref:Nucleoside triphosphate pyrophosphohydrolase n=1 Tax=Alsobacter soli TaxID=2109933 RepID=A0A2T1HXW3_9HYPH|nr:nucleoside triphosphate pyrophosphohydrolase [Alsobacter soli]
MAALRTPGTGCPWDLEQDFASIAPYTIEEAYEVADAIQRGDLLDLKDELGDLLLQVVFHARMAQEQGAFDFGGVVEAITSKMIRRHPHVFGEARDMAPEDVKKLWGEIKASEKAERLRARQAAGRDQQEHDGLLDGIPASLPGLTRAVKLQAKASTVGFDWNDARLVLAKLREELDEIEAELNAGDRQAVAAELGDMLFAVANLARHLDVDPEAALRGTNAKFERRFRFIERALGKQGRSTSDASLEDMDALWNAAKAEE